MARWHFTNKAAKLSPEDARQYYASGIGALGGVKINKVGPESPLLLQGESKATVAHKLNVGAEMTYDAYVIRAADKNVWITLMGNDGWTYLRILEERRAGQLDDR